MWIIVTVSCIVAAVFTFLLSSYENLLNFLANSKDGGAHISDLSSETKTLREYMSNTEVEFPNKNNVVLGVFSSFVQKCDI